MYTRKSINKYRHTLSDRESKILSNLSYEGKTIFTTNDIKKIVRRPKNILDSMVRKKWILKLKNGVYVIIPLEAGEGGAKNYTIHGFVIASFLVKPYYISYWSALNYHGFTEQVPTSVFIATTKPRNAKEVLDTKFKFVTLKKKKIFGIDEVQIENKVIKISSPEKTIVDCLDHPEHCGGTEEVAKALYFSNDGIDFGKLVKFAKRLSNNAVIKRLAYISETLQIDKCSELLGLVNLKSGYSLLDPTLAKSGKIKEKWKLIVNAPIEPSRWTR